MRDELLNLEEFSCLAEARVVIGDWHEDYNHRRPHSALAMRTPTAFAAAWTASHPPDAQSPPARAARTDQPAHSPSGLAARG